MRIRRGWAERGGVILVVCFFLGILAGTLTGNLGMHPGLLSAEGVGLEEMERLEKRKEFFQEFGNLVVQNQPWRLSAGNWEKFLYLCGHRLKEGGLLWLLGLTVCALPCFCALAGYAGFSMSWIITCYTAQLGLLGLPGFFASCLPQWLLYGPAWYLFLHLGLERPARLRMLPALLALTLMVLGAGAEAFMNPALLAFL